MQISDNKKWVFTVHVVDSVLMFVWHISQIQYKQGSVLISVINKLFCGTQKVNF